MKKTISVFLALLLMLLCAACTPEPTLPSESVTLPPKDDSTGFVPPPVTYHAPMVSASMPTQTQTSKSKDGKQLFEYTQQNLYLILPDHQVAEKILIDFLTRVDFSKTPAQSVLDAATSSYKGQTDWSSYLYSKTYAPTRLDQNVLSLHGSEVIFDGGPRPNSTGISVTYDLATGNALTLRDVLSADYSASVLCKLITESLKDYAKDGLLFVDYEYIISDMFTTNTPIDNWYFSQKGLCFNFIPYEIAPYSSGNIVAEVPYDKLGGLIKDQYFPAERPALYGSVFANKYSTEDLTQYEQFSELVLDSNGQQYILYTDGTVFNLTVETGNWSQDGIFTYAGTVFAAASISAGDGIIIKAKPETLASLQLRCLSEGKEKTYNISNLLN